MDYLGLLVVVILLFDCSSDVICVIDFGVMGFILKCSSIEILEYVLCWVMFGGIYVFMMWVFDEGELVVWWG